MMIDGNPKKAFGFFYEEMDGESVIYRLGAHKAIHLNATATLIWRLSDGSRSVQQLIDFLKLEYPTETEIPSDVTDAIRMLSQEGALLLAPNDNEVRS